MEKRISKGNGDEKKGKCACWNMWLFVCEILCVFYVAACVCVLR